MHYKIMGLLLLAVSYTVAAEAQTIAGRMEPTWDAAEGMYVYGPLEWGMQAAPRSERSDEFSMNLYYNKAGAFMAVTVACYDPETDYLFRTWSFSGEHFLSLTTGLIPGSSCFISLTGGNDRAEELAYRMTVSERVTRPTDERQVSTALPRLEPRYSTGRRTPAAMVSETLRHVARALANDRGR